jgi:hypothetical protein
VKIIQWDKGKQRNVNLSISLFSFFEGSVTEKMLRFSQKYNLIGKTSIKNLDERFVADLSSFIYSTDVNIFFYEIFFCPFFVTN